MLEYQYVDYQKSLVNINRRFQKIRKSLTLRDMFTSDVVKTQVKYLQKQKGVERKYVVPTRFSKSDALPPKKTFY